MKHTSKGESKTRLYQIWSTMKQRCYNENSPQYANYGDRGIFICDDWRFDFMKFKEWAYKNGYKKRLTIDRINNEDGYNPDNCRWATMREQENNRRDNINLTFKGKTQTIAQWSRETGIYYQTLFYRVYVAKMSAEDALTKPLRGEYGRNKRVIQIPDFV